MKVENGVLETKQGGDVSVLRPANVGRAAV